MNIAPFKLELYKLRRRPVGVILALFLAVLLKGTLFLAGRYGAFGGIENGFAFLALSATYSLFLASFLLALLAAASLSSEYHGGLLRMQLARPVSRNAFFLQRALFLCFLAILVVALDGAVGTLVGWGGYGFADVADPALQGPQFGASAMAWSSIKGYLHAILGLCGLLGLGLLISVTFRTPTTATGIMAALFFLMEGIRHLFREPLASYMITAHTSAHLDHLSKLARGIAEYQAPGSGMKALLVPLAYVGVTVLIGLALFRKTDVLE